MIFTSEQIKACVIAMQRKEIEIQAEGRRRIGLEDYVRVILDFINDCDSRERDASQRLGGEVDTEIKALRSSGERDYCYIESDASPGGAIMYRLCGNIPWRMDNDIFRSQDFYEAYKRAKELGCPIK